MGFIFLVPIPLAPIHARATKSRYCCGDWKRRGLLGHNFNVVSLVFIQEQA